MVSVIIPSYNRKDTILQSINSVLNQTYSDIEVIVVDDCSIDGTEEVIQSIKSDKLKYIRCSQNMGVATARNIGLENARGEYIAFNDSDDIWKKNKLELQMKEFETNPDYGMIYCAFLRKRGEKVLYIMPSQSEDRSNLSGNMFDSLIRRNVIGTPTMLLKREVFNVVGNFKSGLRILDDYEFALRVAQSFPIGFVDEILVDTYELEDTINAITANTIEAYMCAYLDLHDYWKKEGILEKHKKVFLTQIVDVMKRLDIDRVLAYSERLVPKYFTTEEELLEIYGKERSLHRNQYKDYVMRKIFSEGILDVVKYIGDKKTAIYGNGYVGKCLYYILKKNDTRIECVIDRDVKAEEYSVVTLDDALENVELIILTVYDPIKKLEMEIRRHHPDKEVVFISEVFVPV